MGFPFSPSLLTLGFLQSSKIGENYEFVGIGIIGVFILFWTVSILIYKTGGLRLGG